MSESSGIWAGTLQYILSRYDKVMLSHNPNSCQPTVHKERESMKCKCEYSEDHSHGYPCGKEVKFNNSEQWDDREKNRCCYECYDMIVENTKREVRDHISNFGK